MASFNFDYVFPCFEFGTDVRVSMPNYTYHEPLVVLRHVGQYTRSITRNLLSMHGRNGISCKRYMRGGHLFLGNTSCNEISVNPDFQNLSEIHATIFVGVVLRIVSLWLHAMLAPSFIIQITRCC